MNPRPVVGGSAVEIARRFLALLDARRWGDAAELVHADTAERFRTQQMELARLQSSSLASRSVVGETRFLAPHSLLRGTAAAAATEPATAILARFAEAMDPASVLAAIAPGHSGPEPRITRTVLSFRQTSAGTARAEFRLEWEHGRPGSIHALALERAPEGWRIRDVDLAPLGGGRLLLTDAEFAVLKALFAEDAAS
jgi:hypothetical protein